MTSTYHGIFFCLVYFLPLIQAKKYKFLQVNETGRRRIDIGRFPIDDFGNRRGPQREDGDVYEFHRFQHYGFKTPAPNTFSVESMLAFLAPLATIPIIASAALSGLASILPSFGAGEVTGRSRREVLIDAMQSKPSFNASAWEETSQELRHHFRRDLGELDIIQKYLKQTRPRHDYNDEVMATYLQCSGMLGPGNHCLERLVCQFSDSSSHMAHLEKDVASLIIYTILNNKHIKEEFKDRLRKAAFFGRDSNGRCGIYTCSRKDFSAA